MKHLILSLGLLALSATLVLAQPASTNTLARALGVPADTNATIAVASSQVKLHIGAKAAVTGTVAEVNKTANLVRLNFDKPFPEQSFTAVVFSRYTNQFPNLEALKGKPVEVTGKIMLYRNHPEIQLQSSNQLKVVEAPAGTEKH